MSRTTYTPYRTIRCNNVGSLRGSQSTLKAMKELILLKETMSSIEIAELTSKQHSNVMRDIRNLLEQGVSQINFELAEYSDNQGKPRPCYNLTKKGCLILASGYDAKLREKIIDRCEELEIQSRQGFQVPSSFSEALMLAARQAEEIEKANKHIAVLAPKADFADKAFDTDGKIDIGQAAKILNLGYGRNTLFKKLRKEGVFFANRNEPKQRFVDAGYFELKEQLIPRENHPSFTVMKVLVTQKGLAYINHILGGEKSDGKLLTIT